jgi:peptide/nickel transport system substrate-binding protein
MTQLRMVGSICLYIPLGGFTQPSAWRKSLSGVLDSPATPIFWNIDKSE